MDLPRAEVVVVLAAVEVDRMQRKNQRDGGPVLVPGSGAKSVRKLELDATPSECGVPESFLQELTAPLTDSAPTAAGGWGKVSGDKDDDRLRRRRGPRVSSPSDNPL